MANPSYVEQLTGSLPPDHRKVWKRVWDYVLTNLRYGPLVHQGRAENVQAYALTFTTSSVANTEVSVAHGLARVPYLVMPAMPLDQVGAQVVPLRVTRAADASRIYLSSPSTSATAWVWVE